MADKFLNHVGVQDFNLSEYTEDVVSLVAGSGDTQNTTVNNNNITIYSDATVSGDADIERYAEKLIDSMLTRLMTTANRAF